MISNIEKNIINFSNTHYVDENYFRNIGEKRTPVKGDVLYTVTGSYGIPVLVDFDKEFCFQRHIALLRPNTKVITQKYLYYALQTNSVYQQATEKATGTAQKTVGLGVLRNIKIPYIELGRQLNIVLAIESKLSVCDKIEQTVDETLQKAEQLRQSILKQAFEGRLV
jgi:type I restriction enzyme S subunit